ncbi:MULTISPECIES: hypothetical protein [Burkholderia cepacia complex]|uniref:hypothetical protein n=1 Tax=Burkholderia cepacia complex TaxID=87882 RepID=UPI00157B98FE|nr:MULTISPECIES: hypothetical protein [Burkholderia cepacia complex]NTY37136.1 hypothetical protein [Burkholderia diffusa]
MSSIYSISPVKGSDQVALEQVCSGAQLPAGYSSFTVLRTGERTHLIAYDKATQRTDAYALTGQAPWVSAVDAKLDLSGGPWDNLDTFVLGNVHYLLTYRADTGTFGFFTVKEGLATSPPYTFALPRNTPTHNFTDIAPYTSLGQQYLLGYDVNTGQVANFSVAVTPVSKGGVPPLLALNVWYHQWAKGWTQFSFFQLGGANFFFKINTAKLNVNIDHIQDNPALGTVEVGSYLQGQLPDALRISSAACVPWAHGEPYLITYIAQDGTTAVYRIHADCLGWTPVGSTATPSGAARVVPYRLGDTSYALFC